MPQHDGCYGLVKLARVKNVWITTRRNEIQPLELAHRLQSHGFSR